MKRWFIPVMMLLGIVVLSACSSAPTAALTLAPVEALPAALQTAPEYVRTAYQFALANPDALKNVPCTCGCQQLGHSSNYACFIRQANADGTFVFETHALGCGVCLDIAHDVMRLTTEGKAPTAIRAYIIRQYTR